VRGAGLPPRAGACVAPPHSGPDRDAHAELPIQAGLATAASAGTVQANPSRRCAVGCVCPPITAPGRFDLRPAWRYGHPTIFIHDVTVAAYEQIPARAIQITSSLYAYLLALAGGV
jgi:hypothetical protein